MRRDARMNPAAAPFDTCGTRLFPDIYLLKYRYLEMRTALRKALFHWVPAIRIVFPAFLLLGLLTWTLQTGQFGEDELMFRHTEISVQENATTTETPATPYALQPELIPSDAVAVVLPSTADLMLLDFPRHVLAAFIKGALPPWEMVMVISGYDAMNASHFEAQFTLCAWVQNRFKGVCRELARPWEKLHTTPLILVLFTPEKQNAATSRNLGASLTSAPLISFFDSDDVPHPQRLLVLQRIFHVHPHLNLLLHSHSTFTNQSNYETTRWEKYDVEAITKDAPIFDYPWSVYQSVYGKYYKEHFVQKPWNFSAVIPYCSLLLNDSLVIHNGWPTVRREVFFKIQFNATFDRG